MNRLTGCLRLWHRAGPFVSNDEHSIAGLQKTIDTGIEKVKAMLPLVNDISRTKCPASELQVALQCGGSDAWSGVTANPALGEACDLLTAQGGTGVLSETPEIYGAEHLLTRRAVDQATGERLVGMIKWWENYTARNQDAWTTTRPKQTGWVEHYSGKIGCCGKGGTSPLMGVYKYAEPVRAKGLPLWIAPVMIRPQ